VTATGNDGDAFLDAFEPPTDAIMNTVFKLVVSVDPGVSSFLNNGGGGTYTGDLVDITLTASTALGSYNGGVISLRAFNQGVADTAFVLYSVDVTAAVTSAAPEPSTAVLAVLGGAAFVAYGSSRHRRAHWRQAPG
jgi:hypothetical protein